jgi:PERQ amino acid-rich with GYF domain-containing protein
LRSLTFAKKNRSRRPNGATQTFRRPSQLNTNSTSKEISQQISTPTTGAYVPPHANPAYQAGRNVPSNDLRYSKEDMLEVFKGQEDEQLGNGRLQNLFTEGWVPGSGGTSKDDWSRRDEARDLSHNVEICWDFDGVLRPLALTELDEDEKEV